MAAVTCQAVDLDSPAQYLPTFRPWFALLGVRLRPRSEHVKQGELSLIEKLLPEEVLLGIFALLPITAVATAQSVCLQWRRVGGAQTLWRRACRDAFFTTTMEANARLVAQQYRGCWKRMLLERPHLRFDGIYVSRNTYLKRGVVEWNVKNAAHMVLYFRYCRFFPDGTFVYRTSPEPLNRVHRTLAPPTQQQQQQQQQRQAAAQRAGGGGQRRGGRDRGEREPEPNHIMHFGRFKQEGERVWTALRYDLRSSTELRMRLRLRSTVPGANNRLDCQSIVSWDGQEGGATPLMDLQPDAEAGEGAEQRAFSRGMLPYVFVQFEQINSHPVSLPFSEMDVYMPG